MTRMLLLFALLCSFQLAAQLPKGDRILAWQVDQAENNDYDSAFLYAQNACMESIHLAVSWSTIESNSGNFDAGAIAGIFDVANIYYPAFGTKVELQLATINTVAKETPADLINTDFDDPLMVNRFKTFLDTVFAHIPDMELSALNIGNEHDIYFGGNATAYSQYKSFLNEIVPYAKQLYFNLHGTNLKVGTTFTFDGLIDTSSALLCQSVNDSLDIVSTTYYPLNSDYTMEDPSIVSSDFGSLVTLYPNINQPIYFAECGYSSGALCNSSEAKQAEFYQHVFSAWDTYQDNIKYLTIFKSTDWSQASIDTFEIYYGISDPIFLEYLATLGVRNWEGDGSNKLAYGTILCELEARNWCSVTCLDASTSSLENSVKLSLHPNPVTDLLFIESEMAVESIQISTLNGTIVQNSIQNQIDVSSLTPGVYIATIQTKNKRIARKKFIKSP